jgi:hypothetical protein
VAVVSDVIVCGLPRSGSTLVCELLNKAPDAVALDEPLPASAWMRRRLLGERFDADHFVRAVGAFFDETRRSLRAGTGATSKVVEGRVSGGKFVDERSSSGLRDQVTSIGRLAVDKELSDDFVLAVKHNAGFAAALEHLAPRYRCFAVVRNPLSILASWQTVDVPVQQGRVPFGERVDRDLKAQLDRVADATDRQLVVLEWFFDRFARFVPSEGIVRYEEIVSSGGRSLEVVAPGASALDEPLSSRNKAAVYHPETMQALGRRLLETDGSWWRYYTRSDVEALVEDRS